MALAGWPVYGEAPLLRVSSLRAKASNQTLIVGQAGCESGSARSIGFRPKRARAATPPQCGHGIHLLHWPASAGPDALVTQAW
jgi:hypothetical protein